MEQGWTEEHRSQVFANPGPQKIPALEPRPSKVWLRDVYLASFDRLEKSQGEVVTGDCSGTSTSKVRYKRKSGPCPPGLCNLMKSMKL